MQKRISLFFITGILFLSVPLLGAQILNFSSFSDEFIDLVRGVSSKGIVYIVLNDGKPALEASFQTKLPPGVVISLYEDYLKSKGVNAKISKFSESTWRWSGEINKEEKNLLISYLPKGGVTTIEVVSYRSEKNFSNHYPSLIKVYPELCVEGGSIVVSREVFQGNNFSGLFLYSVAGSPETALEATRSKFIRAGWKSRIDNQSSNNNDISFLFKNNLNATIVANREEGETTLLITITSPPLKGRKR